MPWQPKSICSIMIGKSQNAAEESLKLKSDLIDYVALENNGGPLSDNTYAKGGNPEVLNYAYMGSYSDNPTYCYGMISPELVQLFDENDTRFTMFSAQQATVLIILMKVQEQPFGTLPSRIQNSNIWLSACVQPKYT